MRSTQLKEDGYRYFVYLGPGDVKYFYSLESARAFADETGCYVQEMF